MRFCSFILLHSVCFLGISTKGRDIMKQRSNLLPCHGEQVALLSDGLLQLGSGLKREAVHTEERISRILKQIDLFNISLENIFNDVFQTAKLGQDLETKTRVFLLNDTMCQTVAELKKEVAMIKVLGASLEGKIKPLEKKIRKAVNNHNKNDLFPTMSTILSSIENQNTQIEELILVVNIHQDKINMQEQQIETLLKMVESRSIKKKSKRIRDALK
ncbi:uncharacterized protein LOC134612766 [Pelobates fuscus]|uniref:uncharacterized protein LOC134612766 n=1 Tax=Pelobates fuscus TaxID=191477 RepID=UPI002FE45BF0